HRGGDRARARREDPAHPRPRRQRRHRCMRQGGSGGDRLTRLDRRRRRSMPRHGVRLTSARPAVSFPAVEGGSSGVPENLEPDRRPPPTPQLAGEGRRGFDPGGELNRGTERMSIALLFPGQGSQVVGMGRALAQTYPAARAVFDEVDTALGAPLSTLMWEGPADTLTLTENAQPALMAVSLAALRALETEAGFNPARDVRFVAGHSLGEYSALAAAGSLTIADTARL